MQIFQVTKKKKGENKFGFIILIGNLQTSWFSKLHHCVSISTTEAEYYNLYECAKHSLWYQIYIS